MLYTCLLMFQKTYGRLTGWFGYTYSRVFVKTPDVNNGDVYRAFQDRPHNITFFLSYDTGKRWSMSANWIFLSGAAISTPVSFFEYNGYTVPVYGEKNNDRLPDYHRLDLALTWRNREKPGRKWSTDWNFSIYNVYNRKNPLVINFLTDNDTGETYAEMTYLFGIVPAITFNFKFN